MHLIWTTTPDDPNRNSNAQSGEKLQWLHKTYLLRVPRAGKSRVVLGTVLGRGISAKKDAQCTNISSSFVAPFTISCLHLL